MAVPYQELVLGLDANLFISPGSNRSAELAVAESRVPQPRITDEVIFQEPQRNDALIEVVKTLIDPDNSRQEITVITDHLTHSHDGPIHTIGTLFADITSRDYATEMRKGVEQGVKGVSMSFASSFRAPGVVSKDEIISPRYLESAWLIGTKFTPTVRDVYRLSLINGMSDVVRPDTHQRMDEIAKAITAK